ncbi:MAG: hypothetical protein IIC49_00940 [Planctomycetes bacterium]|nr:hypothetical protein [Planctomycetota bacterium]
MEAKSPNPERIQDWHTYKRILLPPVQNLHQLEAYEANGGYQSLRKVLTSDDWSRAKVTDEVKASGLRGRGGAGCRPGPVSGLAMREAG